MIGRVFDLKIPFAGAIDCDLHPPPPSGDEVLALLDDYWRDQIANRHIDRAPFHWTSYPPYSPLTCRPDWRAPDGRAGGDVTMMAREALDRFGSSIGILAPIHPYVTLNNPDMVQALLGALNDHQRIAWLDNEPRLRGSIMVSPENPKLAVQEIERLAPDGRFVQVLLLVMGEAPLGRRQHWPIFEAAARHGLAIAVHAGSAYRWAPSVSGWPSFQFEDYVLQAVAFENLLISFLAEGVFQQFSGLNLVLLESGFLWLPALMWRADKTWRGVRPEIPWVDREPSSIIKERVFVSIQPADAPDPARFARALDHLGGTDMLLFASDYPHWQFDGDEILPDGLPEAALESVLWKNAQRAFPRLGGAKAAAATGDGQ